LTFLELNKNLHTLYCFNNQLTSLHLNEKLHTLHCFNNQLTYLHLNENLNVLHCSYNKLTSLYLNDKLHTLNCFNNQLTYLHLNEKLKIIDYKNNPIYKIINEDDVQIVSHKLKILNKFRYLYYSRKFKKKFRDLLWVKIREPKIRKKYSYDYLIANLKDNDLDEFLKKW
jgi:Leucine-rich repeat (LRR) protein